MEHAPEHERQPEWGEQFRDRGSQITVSVQRNGRRCIVSGLSSYQSAAGPMSELRRAIAKRLEGMKEKVSELAPYYFSGYME